MEICDFLFDGVKLIKGDRSIDERGMFIKKFEKGRYSEHNLNLCFDEIFYSVSKRNVLRGMHFQSKFAQEKLVTVIKGSIFDVIIDLRRNSITYGKWGKIVLNEDDDMSLFIPKGFAHGFLAMSEQNIMLYQCVGRYEQGYDSGIRFDDERIGIEWPVSRRELIISERDRRLMSFSTFENSEREF